MKEGFMYEANVADIAANLLQEKTKVLLVALLIQQAGDDTGFWVRGAKRGLRKLEAIKAQRELDALNEKKGDSK